MSRAPTAPAAATSPYPLTGDRAAERDDARQAMAETAVANLQPEDTGRTRRIAAGAAIGSAAIAAALLFYNRSKSGTPAKDR